MKVQEPPDLLFIEPDRPASREPVTDEFTPKMTAALRPGTRPNITGREIHECVCGATSEAHDEELPNGMDGETFARFVCVSVCGSA